MLTTGPFQCLGVGHQDATRLCALSSRRLVLGTKSPVAHHWCSCTSIFMVLAEKKEDGKAGEQVEEQGHFATSQDRGTDHRERSSEVSGCNFTSAIIGGGGYTWGQREALGWMLHLSSFQNDPPFSTSSWLQAKVCSYKCKGTGSCKASGLSTLCNCSPKSILWPIHIV